MTEWNSKSEGGKGLDGKVGGQGRGCASRQQGRGRSLGLGKWARALIAFVGSPCFPASLINHGRLR